VVSFGITTDNVSGDGTVDFNGMMDEIQIYSQALSPSQITSLYTTDSPNPAPASSVLPSTTPVTLAGGTTLNVNGISQTIGSLTGSIGSVVQLGSGQLTVSTSSSSSFAGNIGGVGGSLIKSGGGTLSLGGSDSYTGGTTVSGGTLLISAASALPDSIATITGGTLQLGESIGLTQLTSLSITGNGVLDIRNNHLILSYGASDPMSTIYGYLLSGYSNDAMDGPGIFSSDARIPENGRQYGVGFADGKDGVVAGLSSGQIEIKYTLLGDANLDGVVNGSDFSILAANFGLGATNWDQGNFWFSSSVNGSDFSALAANFGQGDNGAAVSVSPADFAALDAFAQANGLMADVPEPGMIGALVMAPLLLGRRRAARKSRAVES